MGAVLLVVVVILVAVCFFNLSRTNKLIFVGYLSFFFYELSNRQSDDAIYLFKLFIGAAALFIFLVSISLAKTGEGKRDVALFFLKYGGLYILMVTLIKFVIFAFSGFDSRSWEGIDVVVTLLPYKWVLFILFLAFLRSVKK